MRHPGWYRQRLAPLEMALVGLIVSVLVMVCMSAVPSVLLKARLSEVLLLLADSRIDSTVDISIRGAFLDEQTSPTSEVENAWEVSHIRYQRRGSTTQAHGNLFATTAHSGANTLRVRTPEITLTMRPAIAADAPTWSVLWLCGDHPAPPNWVTANHTLHTGLSTAQTPRVCRNVPH